MPLASGSCPRRKFACDEMPLPIAVEQTIFHPYVAALMPEAAESRQGDCILEIGQLVQKYRARRGPYGTRPD